MTAATRARPLTVPVDRPQWSKPPAPVSPTAIGDCPVCSERVWGLSGSPKRRPHLVRALPCSCWLLVDEANELEDGAWGK